MEQFLVNYLSSSFDDDNRILSKSQIDEIADELSNEITKQIDRQFEAVCK